MTVSADCVLCNSMAEMREHLFFECTFVRDLWHRLLKWLKWDRQIQSWDLEWQWVKKMSRGKHPKRALLKASLATVVYGTWVERNNMIFKQKAAQGDHLLRQMKLHICTRVRYSQAIFSYICSLGN
ncbi:uncharacterized protein LOC132612498 [Lycium barbarum]|uniref:uncharacterized protein LOC132612498 n=1 Tax=Lycium barbarum TaxID=112863 RepID=UPI00293EDE03|nr:uncharacterized protein LOC132612498 [Lycium barbarum]